jgi:hypothetical protein
MDNLPGGLNFERDECFDSLSNRYLIWHVAYLFKS